MITLNAHLTLNISLQAEAADTINHLEAEAIRAQAKQEVINAIRGLDLWPMSVTVVAVTERLDNND